jgi:hypothetical protein
MDSGSQAEYFRLLKSAQEAADAVAEFDLRDQDPQSVAGMEARLRQQRTCNLALVYYVRDHLTDIEMFLMLPAPVAAQVQGHDDKPARIVET